MYQSKASHYTRCVIRKNGNDLLGSSSDNVNPSSAPDGYFQAGNSVIVHLNTGDVVSLGNCYPLSTMDRLTSFSGMLIKSD